MIKFLIPHRFIFTYSCAVKFYYCIPQGNIVEPDQPFDLYNLVRKKKKTKKKNNKKQKALSIDC